MAPTSRSQKEFACEARTGAVAITDQHVVMPSQPIFRGRERPTDLLHEQLVGIWRGPEDVDAARGEVDHEEGVVRDQPAPG